jgi:hypothetical protein
MTRTAWVLFLVLFIFGSGCLTQKAVIQRPETAVETPPPQEINVSEQPKETMPPIKVEEDSAGDGVVEQAPPVDSKHAICMECHGDVKPFHKIKVISIIDERKGINPRICTVCHGQKVHDVHWDILNEERIICDTCHLLNGEFFKPQIGDGQLLICEVCHSGGNYVKIHIEGNILEGAVIDEMWITEGSKHDCGTCHVGDYGTLHFTPLTALREEIDRVVEEAAAQPAAPLNTSST